MQAILCTGDGAQVRRLHQNVEHLRKGQRGHGEVDAAHTQRHDANQHALHNRHANHRQQHGPQPPAFILEQYARGICACAKEHGVAKAQNARVAHEQVIAHGEDGQYEYLNQHPLPELGRPLAHGLAANERENEGEGNQEEQHNGAEPVAAGGHARCGGCSVCAGGSHVPTPSCRRALRDAQAGPGP